MCMFITTALYNIHYVKNTDNLNENLLEKEKSLAPDPHLSHQLNIKVQFIRFTIGRACVMKLMHHDTTVHKKYPFNTLNSNKA